MRPRRLVSPETLLALLNDRLAAYGHCYHCHFGGPIQPLREPAPDGRNWSPHIPLVCANRLSGGCRRLAHRIIEDAAREYNLEF